MKCFGFTMFLPETGVRVERTSGDVDILASMVISDAGVINTYNSLLPKEIAVKSSK